MYYKVEYVLCCQYKSGSQQWLQVLSWLGLWKTCGILCFQLVFMKALRKQRQYEWTQQYQSFKEVSDRIVFFSQEQVAVIRSVRKLYVHHLKWEHSASTLTPQAFTQVCNWQINLTLPVQDIMVEETFLCFICVTIPTKIN